MNSSQIQPSQTSEIIKALMSDANQRAKILEFLTQKGIVPDENFSPNNCLSPLKRLKMQQDNLPKLESPSALARRRALQQLTPSKSKNMAHANSSKSFKKITPLKAPVIPYDRLLKGVIAYCEILVNGEDRSAYVKAMLRSMGATVKEKFDTNVTHVIFKNGLYSTFRKAKSRNIHVVSLLWIKSVKEHGFIVSEDKFPVIGIDAEDVTKVCEEIEKEFQNAVQDKTDMIDPMSEKENFQITPTNKSEIEDVIKSKIEACEASDTDSYYSLDLENNSDILPASQETVTNKKKKDELISVTGLGKIAKDSFELEKASKIRSPESLARRNKSLEKEEDSSLLELRISVTDESNNNTNKQNSTNNSFYNNELSLINNKTPKTIKTIGLKRVSKNTNQDSTAKKIRRKTLSVSDTQKWLQKLEIGGKKILNETKTPDKKESNQNEFKNTTEESFKLDLEVDTNEGHFLKTPNSKRLQTLADKINTDNVNESSGMINDEQIVEKNNIKKTRRQTLGNTINYAALSENESLIEKNNKKENTKRIRRRRTLGNTLKCAEESKNESEEKNVQQNNKKKNIKSRKRQTLKNATIHAEESENEPLEEKNNKKENTKRLRRRTLGNTYKCAEENKNESEETNLEQNNSKRKTKVTSRSFNKDLDTTKNESFVENKENSITETDKQMLQVNDNEISKIKKTGRKTISNMNKTQKNIKEKDLLEANKSGFDFEGNKKEDKIQETKHLFNPNNLDGQNKLLGETNLQDKVNEPAINNKKDENVLKRTRLFNPNNLDYPNESFGKKNLEDKVTESTKDSEKDENKPDGRKRVRLFNSNNLEHLNESFGEKKRKETLKAKTPILSAKARESINKPKTTVLKVSSSEDLDSSSSPQKTMSANRRKSQRFMEKAKTFNISENRRSTLDFVDIKNKPIIKSQKKTKMSSIVCTRLHREDVHIFQNIVNKLGGFIIENEVTKNTTHLIAQNASRTVNLLRAICRGCWIVHIEWLYKSLEAGKWIDEEDYELVEFSPVVKKCRVEKQSFGEFFSLDIFNECGLIHVARCSSPRFSDLEELLLLSGGKISKVVENAKIVVGKFIDQEGVVCVTEKWILDSISNGKKLNLQSYLIQSSAIPIST